MMHGAYNFKMVAYISYYDTMDFFHTFFKTLFIKHTDFRRSIS